MQPALGEFALVQRAIVARVGDAAVFDIVAARDGGAAAFALQVCAVRAQFVGDEAAPLFQAPR